MAHGGTGYAPARKAKATLHDVDTREVSTVDKPAIGETFLLIKSEGGVAAKKTTGAAPVQKDEIADAAKPKVKPSGEPQPPEALDGAAPAAKDDETAGDEVSMALPPDAKGAFVAGITFAVDRLTDLLAIATGASDAIAVDGQEVPEVPGDYLVKVLDVAGGLAKMVEPYAKGFGIVDDTEKGADGKPMAKADGAPGARCTWTQEYIDSLSDWCFLDVTPSMDRDTEYRTQPLTNRHFPIRDHAGRLCLAAVLDAIDALATPTPALAPWLTESKRIEMLLRLACMRLDEVSIAIRRDGMAPESAAELGWIAELLEMVGGTSEPGEPAQPAAPAAGAPGAEKAANPATPGSQPIGTEGAPANATPTGGEPPKDVPTLAQKAAGMFRALAKSAGAAPMTPEHAATLKAAKACMAKAMEHFAEASGHMEKTMKAVDAFYEGKLPDATGQAEFGKPPVAGAPNPSGAVARPADAVAQPPEALAEKAALAKALADIGRLKADQAALQTRVAKAERAVPASRVNGDEPKAPVAKSNDGAPPCSMDLNDLWAREAAGGTSGAR